MIDVYFIFKFIDDAYINRYGHIKTIYEHKYKTLYFLALDYVGVFNEVYAKKFSLPIVDITKIDDTCDISFYDLNIDLYFNYSNDKTEENYIEINGKKINIIKNDALIE